jgi:hypothetical protein
MSAWRKLRYVTPFVNFRLLATPLGKDALTETLYLSGLGFRERIAESVSGIKTASYDALSPMCCPDCDPEVNGNHQKP